jgi:hypothetical protein
MDIHKPKPWHGGRELLKEIGTIVIGVLIALAGEQVVEWLHWREVVAETRKALDHELAGDLGVVQTRIDQAPCIARRVSEFKAASRLRANGQPIPLKGPVGQPQFPHIRTSVWETAIADQSASHMPLDLKLRYAGLYESLYWLREKSAQETEAWSHLTELDDQDVLDDQDWSALRQWKARAQALAEKVDANVMPSTRNGVVIGPFFDQAAKLGIKPAPYQFAAGAQATVNAYCKALL